MIYRFQFFFDVYKIIFIIQYSNIPVIPVSYYNCVKVRKDEIDNISLVQWIENMVAIEKQNATKLNPLTN